MAMLLARLRVVLWIAAPERYGMPPAGRGRLTGPGRPFRPSGVPEGADGYILANVLHDWDDADAVRILGARRRAMANDGRLLIVERLIPNDLAEACRSFGRSEQANPLRRPGTDNEYGQLLIEASLNLTGVQPVIPPYGVIEGLAP